MTDKLIELFADELDVEPEELNEDSSPDTVDGWDSLAAVRLVAALESEFDVELSTKEIMKMRSISIARGVLKEKGADV